MELIVSETSEAGVELMKSVPFQSFRGDCNGCKHFATAPLSSPSGKCELHKWWCGLGFTCKDFKSLK